MHQLITIGQTSISSQSVQTVNARDLHAFLEIGKDFSNWIKDRIEHYGFIENQDFVIVAKTGEKSGRGRRAIGYAITLDTAKEISMVERNARGKEARQYFIECERKLLLGAKEDAQRMTSRQVARLEAPYLTDAIKHHREAQGKPIAHYHFSNEFDLINRVALGQSAKAFRLAHDIAPGDPIRDHLTRLEIRCIEHLQRSNATMIDLNFDYEQRKTELHKLYVLRHSISLMNEVKRIEA